ncbi:membrane protein UL148 [Aotine betaherpesvirus 1]|uniref:Membrane protein UL148 n=1 Tax=Aotine betaherpesvirus 1 TaxID=50290 RepID=G8XUI6_9BETA|nr:membrane protein UL148 [Aotine betaherpesvirus 1]AEV80827.1 membrane protein UL148 [Aotine betaherpesvirus 1]
MKPVLFLLLFIATVQLYHATHYSFPESEIEYEYAGTPLVSFALQFTAHGNAVIRAGWLMCNKTPTEDCVTLWNTSWGGDRCSSGAPKLSSTCPTEYCLSNVSVTFPWSEGNYPNVTYASTCFHRPHDLEGNVTLMLPGLTDNVRYYTAYLTVRANVPDHDGYFETRTYVKRFALMLHTQTGLECGCHEMIVHFLTFNTTLESGVSAMFAFKTSKTDAGEVIKLVDPQHNSTYLAYGDNRIRAVLLSVQNASNVIFQVTVLDVDNSKSMYVEYNLFKNQHHRAYRRVVCHPMQREHMAQQCGARSTATPGDDAKETDGAEESMKTEKKTEKAYTVTEDTNELRDTSQKTFLCLTTSEWFTFGVVTVILILMKYLPRDR